MKPVIFVCTKCNNEMRNQKKRDISHDLSLDVIGVTILGMIVCMFLSLIL